jgi:phage shock protein E
MGAGSYAEMNAIWIGLAALFVLVIVARFTLGASTSDRAAANEKIKQGAAVVDVRTPAEYEAGHYKGATNIPLQELQSRLTEMGDKSMAIVVYCASGMRSARAAAILAAAGFTDVTDAGGLRNLEP